MAHKQMLSVWHIIKYVQYSSKIKHTDQQLQVSSHTMNSTSIVELAAIYQEQDSILNYNKEILCKL